MLFFTTRMKNNTLLMILVVAVAFVAGYFIIKKTPAPTPTPQIVDTTPKPAPLLTEKYVDPVYHFSLNYDLPFTIASSDVLENSSWSNNSAAPGQKLVMVVISRDFMPKTNFSEALISVGVSQDKSAVKDCLIATNGETAAGTVVIGGTTFTKLAFNDAAAGNLYDTTMYRTIKGSSCFSLESIIHTTNIGAYDPSQGITAFDKSKIDTLVAPAVNSFKFL